MRTPVPVTIAYVSATLVAASVVLQASPGRAQEQVVPTTKVVVYPGQIVTDAALADLALDHAEADERIARSRIDVVGKMARFTLLPGRAILLDAIGNPRLVRNGAQVMMIYVDGALTITSSGVAMQDGVLGDYIKVRNADSGVVIRGRVRADGAIFMGNGG